MPFSVKLYDPDKHVPKLTAEQRAMLIEYRHLLPSCKAKAFHAVAGIILLMDGGKTISECRAYIRRPTDWIEKRVAIFCEYGFEVFMSKMHGMADMYRSIAQRDSDLAALKKEMVDRDGVSPTIADFIEEAARRGLSISRKMAIKAIGRSRKTAPHNYQSVAEILKKDRPDESWFNNSRPMAVLARYRDMKAYQVSRLKGRARRLSEDIRINNSRPETDFKPCDEPEVLRLQYLDAAVKPYTT